MSIDSNVDVGGIVAHDGTRRALLASLAVTTTTIYTAGVVPEHMNGPLTAEEVEYIHNIRAEHLAASNRRPEPPPRKRIPSVLDLPTNDVEIRASAIGEGPFINPVGPHYSQADHYVKGEPAPIVISGDQSATLLQTVLTNALPWYRSTGAIPQPGDCPPGASIGLTTLEAQWVADMLTAERTS